MCCKEILRYFNKRLAANGDQSSEMRAENKPPSLFLSKDPHDP